MVKIDIHKIIKKPPILFICGVCVVNDSHGKILLMINNILLLPYIIMESFLMIFMNRQEKIKKR